MNVYVKGLLREQGVGIADKEVHAEQAESRSYRRISQQRIIARLGLSDYPTHLDNVVEHAPTKVSIPLRHGVGKPSTPTVAAGDRVQAGDIVAAVDFNDVGCMIHASIDGVVTGIDGSITIEHI
jgi:biotin carboxyl carrier protein